MARRGHAARRALALSAALLALGPASAHAGKTEVIGQETSGYSDLTCPENQRMTWLDVATDDRGYVVQLWFHCTDASGKDMLGWRSWTNSEPADSGRTECDPGVLPTGLTGRSGDVLDAVGLVCGGVPGTPVGGRGGGPARADCPEGEMLVGLATTVATYGGYPVFTSVQGSCGPVPYQPTRLTAETLRAATLGSGEPRVAATLVESGSGGPLAGRTIHFTSGQAELCAGVTDTGGRASCQPSGAGLATLAASDEFRASFAGTELAYPSSAIGRTGVRP